MSHESPSPLPSPCRSRSRKAALFALLLSLLLVGFFVPFDARNFRELAHRFSDAMHLPLFALVTLALFSVFPRGTWHAPLISLLLVFAVEVIQPLTGRSASEIDIVNGALGVILVTLGVRHQIMSANRRQQLLYGAGAALSVGVVFFPIYRAAQAEILQRRLFPVLSSFEHPAEFILWRTVEPILTSANYFGPTNIWRRDGSKGMIFVSKGQGFGGIEYNAGDRDWSSFHTLVIPLTVSNGPVEFHVRIDDDHDCRLYEDRFNAHFSLEQGEHELRISLDDVRQGPVERDLNLKSIRRVVFVVGPHVLARELVFDAIRLEPIEPTP